MAHTHTVHLPLGALLSWCTVCGYRSRTRTTRSPRSGCLLLSVTVRYYVWLQVKDAYDTLSSIKKNMREVQDVLSGWSSKPLLVRKPTKTYLPEEFEEEHKAQLAARYAEITAELLSVTVRDCP